jgi:hypothetical protein
MRAFWDDLRFFALPFNTESPRFNKKSIGEVIHAVCVCNGLARARARRDRGSRNLSRR